MSTNKIKSFTLNDDNTFTENKTIESEDKANELKTKFGDLAIDVASEVLSTIEHEDNRMYCEIKFWTEVKGILKNGI